MYIILSLSLSLIATHAQIKVDTDRKGIAMLSYKYSSGPYLVYDCEDQHYACASDKSNDECKYRKQESIKKRKNILSCISILKFKTERKCIDKMKKLINDPKDKSFCKLKF